MLYDVVIEVSRDGVVFQHLATLHNLEIGAPFEITDAPVPPGQLRIYRARYQCTSDPSIFSEWSLIYARGPYPVVATGDPATMGDIRTAAMTALAISEWENTPGKFCRASKYVSLISHTLGVNRTITEDPSNDGGVEDTAYVGAGVSRSGGQIVTNFTPSGGFLGLFSTVYGLNEDDVQDFPAAGDVDEYFDQLWKPGHRIPTVTIHSKEGDDVLLYGGAYGNTLSYKASKTQNTPIQVTLGINNLTHAVKPGDTEEALSALGLTTAGYSTVDPLGPTDWVLRLDGVDLNCTEHGLDYNRNLQPGDVGNNFMGPKFYYHNKAQTSITATIFWDDMKSLQDFYGVTYRDKRDFGVWKRVRKMPLSLLYLPGVNDFGYRNETELVASRCAIMSYVKEIPNDGAIMQQITIKPLKDPAQGLIGHYWRTRNAESYPSLSRRGWEVADIPVNELFPWFSVGGKLAAGATTTVMTAQASAKLSPVDGFYIGKTLRLLLPPSSANANRNQERIITGYVAATRQFTVNAAFNAVPGENTEFLIGMVEPAA